MKNTAINIILILSMGCLCFGKLYHGMGVQMTLEGTGVYYKQLWSLNEYSQFTGDAGFRFNSSQYQTDIFGMYNNYHSIMLDLTTGYRYELFSDQPIGVFRPIIIVGAGGISDLKSFSKKHIAGIWMIKYMLGTGIQFYNRNNMNQLSLHFTHSQAIKSNVVFQLAFYWK